MTNVMIGLSVFGIAVACLCRIWAIARENTRRIEANEEWYRQHAPLYLDPKER